MQGAGGVGGLLQVDINEGSINSYYPVYDGNGNISEYFDSTGATVAHYQYDAFGREVGIPAQQGPDHDKFAHRFSTKYLDDETGLYYYGYRYYDPVTGRWPSRDPIGERGGVNLYGFVGNAGVNWIDVNGLISLEDILKCGCEYICGKATGFGGAIGSFFTGLCDMAALAAKYGNPIGMAINAGDAIDSGNAVAVGVNKLIDMCKDGEAKEALRPILGPDVMNLIELDPGSPEWCKSLGALEGKAAFEVVLAMGTGGGSGAIKTGKLSSKAAKLAEEVEKVVPKKPSLSDHKKALKKVHDEVGKQPKGKPGKFGSPQAGDSKKEYRLDPAHPDAPAGSPETGTHINWWDYTKGKKGRGGRSGAVPVGN